MNERELTAAVAKIVRGYTNTLRRSVPEFSKRMIKLYAYACIAWITASYVLAALDKQVNDGVTIAVITSLAAVLLGYFSKSWRENIAKYKKGDPPNE